MPNSIKSRNAFFLFFIIVLIIDISIKINYEIINLRFISKSILSILLMIYFFVYNRELLKIKWFFMIMALLFFLIGDIFFILYEIELYYIFGIFSFTFGKLFYIFRFSNQNDFKFKQLLPVLFLCFSLMITVLFLINDNLNNFFFPTLLYLFIVTLLFVFTFLRKGMVSKKSYYMVFLGVILSLFSDFLTALSSFYVEIPYNGIGIMLFYGLSQLFIVFGIVEETNPCKL